MCREVVMMCVFAPFCRSYAVHEEDTLRVMLLLTVKNIMSRMILQMKKFHLTRYVHTVRQAIVPLK